MDPRAPAISGPSDERAVVYYFKGKRTGLWGKRESLYVGPTTRVPRFNEHERGKDWFPEVDVIEVTHTTVADAAAVERRTIRGNKPRYNVQHNPGVARDRGHGAIGPGMNPQQSRSVPDGRMKG